MKDYWNSYYLDDANFICNCKTVKNYSMVLNGKIPFLNRLQRLYKISGELYDINEDDLKHVDDLEGNNSFYFRRKLKVVDDNNKEYEVYTYFNSTGEGITLPDGNFKNHVKPN